MFELDHFHVPRSLARSLKKGGFEVSFDRDFIGVIHACAEVPRADPTTWITPEFIAA